MITQNEWDKQNLLENASTQLKIEAIRLADTFESGEAVDLGLFVITVRKYEKDAEKFARQGNNN